MASFNLCSPDIPFTKDDIYTSQHWLFGILGGLTLLVLLFCIANAYILAKNKRFKNLALFFFYLFSFFTLFCNTPSILN